VEVKDGETTVARYAYDGLNHRITKTVGETITHAYYNSGWQLLETRVGAGAPETLDPKTQYVWSVRYIDALILRDRNNDENPDLEERLYYLNDANMNVTALIADDGTVLERYAYTPYGKPSFFDASWNPRAESAYDNAILYCGYFFDDESGLYSVRHRYYHPTLGRWLSRDLERYLEGMCLYEYCRGIPTRTVDPMGRFSFSTVGDVVESVSRAVVEAVAAAEAVVSGATGTAIRETASYVFGEGSPEEAFSRFATGVGAPTEVFTQGAFLGSLKKHAKIAAARAKAKATLEAGCVYPSCQTSYDARKFVHEYIGLRGVLEGAENYIGIIGQYAPFGAWERLGKNKAEVWLGTFQGTWIPNYVDCCLGTATLEFNVTDIWNTRSMTGWSHDEERLSGEDILSDPFGALGQMWRTGKVVPGWVLSERPYGGWFGSKTLEFSWSEDLDFKGDTRCPGRN
jgi:RHS repeat-associated protein